MRAYMRACVNACVHVTICKHLIGEERVKCASRPKWAPSLTAFLVCNAVKTTAVVFTDPSGGTSYVVFVSLARMQNGE